jgi:molybdopterin/thiamine biosynthesis adenylyltransferase
MDLERYSRQITLPGFGEAGQRRLLAARVAVVGMGALGSLVSTYLARAGIGNLLLIDRDYVELNNLQRQVLFDETDARTLEPKALAAARKLSAANSQGRIQAEVADLNPTNAERLLAGCDLVVDGTDNFQTRYLINDYSIKHDVPWVYGGVIGSYGLSITFVPGSGPCLRCLFPDPPQPGTVPTCETAGVLGPAAGMVASWQAAETIKLLLGQGAVNRGVIYFDLWNCRIETLGEVSPSPHCPACSQRRFEFLDSTLSGRTTSLCGRNAVQVLPARPFSPDFPALAERLKAIGRVAYNDYLLRFVANGYEITLFADGRAIVKGTEDQALAQSLYARYIGH